MGNGTRSSRQMGSGSEEEIYVNIFAKINGKTGRKCCVSQNLETKKIGKCSQRREL
jgi:hypothetical protein